MPPASEERRAALRALVRDIEREMRMLGIWIEGDGPAPVAGALFLSIGFHPWLQLHYLPSVVDHFETGIEGGIARLPIRELDWGPTTGALVTLCGRLQRLVEPLPAAAFTTSWQPWPPPSRLAPPLPVVHLWPGDGEPVAAWAGFARADVPALRVDLRAHPDARFRCERVLELTVDAGGGRGSIALHPGALGGLRRGEIALVARPALDWPAPPLLRELGHPSVRRALEAGDTSLELRVARRSYERTWWVTHPYEAAQPCAAQLSGWPLAWSDRADDHVGQAVVLRTYWESEPWVEVLGASAADRLTVRVRTE